MYKHVVAQQVITYMRWLKRQPPGLGNSQRPSAAFKLMVYPGVQWCPRYGIHMYPYSPHNMNYPCFFPLSCDSPCFILTSILHIDYVWLCISIYIYTLLYTCVSILILLIRCNLCCYNCIISAYMYILYVYTANAWCLLGCATTVAEASKSSSSSSPRPRPRRRRRRHIPFNINQYNIVQRGGGIDPEL